MKKLFQLKEWLTLESAAKHLSTILQDEVSVADILQLGLDKHLILSVHFVNHARGRKGYLEEFTEETLHEKIRSGDSSDLKWHTFPPGAMEAVVASWKDTGSMDSTGTPDDIQILRYEKISPDAYVTLTDEFVTLKGVFDLPMIGAEKLDIQSKFEELTSQQEVKLTVLAGAFVHGTNGELFQLQDRFDADTPESGEYKIQSNDYFPAAGLPEDGVIVVRTKALTAFENRISDDKPLGTTERTSLLRIIGALCDYSNIDFQVRGAARRIAEMTEQIGAPVTDDTILKFLTKIKDAVERRK